MPDTIRITGGSFWAHPQRGGFRTAAIAVTTITIVNAITALRLNNDGRLHDHLADMHPVITMKIVHVVAAIPINRDIINAIIPSLAAPPYIDNRIASRRICCIGPSPKVDDCSRSIIDTGEG